MDISIFIRTYKNDLDWLQYCLRSIQKYVTGYKEIVICIPENQVQLINEWNLTKERIVTCPIYGDDYLGQQVSKLNSDTYCNSEYILFVDSDCVFTEPVDLTKRMFFNSKPVIYKTHYHKVGDAVCWKRPTESSLNMAVEWEYMRRMPIIYKSETIKDLRDYLELIHGRPMDIYVTGRSGRDYSEFNVLGAFADYFCNDQYHFHDTEYGIEPNFLIQHWSWGGITPEIKNQIEEICK